MAKRKSTKTIETLRHEDASRKNIPTAEYQAVMAENDRNPIKVAYKRRNRDLGVELIFILTAKSQVSRSQANLAHS